MISNRAGRDGARTLQVAPVNGLDVLTEEDRAAFWQVVGQDPD